jgi:light-regulated signal transduction histidine kinase (bacteriophytochrome)
MVVAAFELLRRDLRTREAASAAVRQARDSLEIKVQERTAELGTMNQALESEIGQRRQAQEKLEVFAEQLQRSNRELQEFASIASHDLQEPLRKIQAFGDRLQRLSGNQLSAEGIDFLTRMQHAAARMRKLIDDLLAFSRLTTRAQEAAPVDLNVVAREVLEDLEGRLAQTGGRVELGTLPVIEADASQMRQLLQNLIGNGLKFHKPGESPTVKVSARSLANDPAAGGAANGHPTNACELRIEDDGIGFDLKYLDRIFNVFQRLHGRNEYEGTGMGLAICRKIVERHHGQITAQSEPGRGATFILILPLEQQSHGGLARESLAEAHHDSDGR